MAASTGGLISAIYAGVAIFLAWYIKLEFEKSVIQHIFFDENKEVIINNGKKKSIA